MMHFFTLKKYYFKEIIYNIKIAVANRLFRFVQEEVHAKPKQIIKLFKAYEY